MTVAFVPLAAVAKVNSGYAFKSKDFVSVGNPIIRISNLTGRFVNLEKAAQVPNSSVEGLGRFKVSSNDILIAMSGATTGKISKVPTIDSEVYLNQRVGRFVLNTEKVNSEYFFYFLNSDKFQSQVKFLAAGAAQPNISGGQIETIVIPLPPLQVQKQIAAVLEKADTLRQQSQQMEQEFNLLAQSVFLDIFGDSYRNERMWVSKTVLDVSKKVTDGTHQSPEWAAKGIPFLFISNIRDGDVNFETNKFITYDCFRDLTKTSPIETNDILYTTVGSYGHVALVKSSFPKFCFQRHIAHIKPDPDKILPEFLYYQLQTKGCKHQADNMVRGIAQKTLNLKDLKSMKIIVPPTALQEEYVSKISALLNLKQNIKVNRLNLDSLFSSLIQRAFKGELDLKDVA